jgi:hypothetical protein
LVSGEPHRDLERLTEETDARVALLSLPVLGQELGSKSVPRSAEYSEVVREVAAASRLPYLPLHERQAEHLRAAGQVPGIRFRDGRTVQSWAAMQHFLLRRSFDSISRRRGLELTTDLIHQNTRGAAMIAELIDEFLASG